MNGRYLLKKFRKFCIILFSVIILLILLIAFLITSLVVSAHNIDEVTNVKISDIDTESAKLSWDNVKRADGYFIYERTEGDAQFKKVGETDDKTEYVVTNLNESTKYEFYITAYKGSKKNIESKTNSSIKMCTLPIQEKISLSSPLWGEMTVEWIENDLATGYIIEYIEGKDSDFTDANSITIDDSSINSKLIDELDYNAYYSVRVCSYVEFDGEKIKGQWSEAKSVKTLEYLHQSETIDPNRPMVALSFDDGPGYNSASDDILDILEKYGVKATFFMIGTNAKDHPDNVKRKVELGMEIGNHTYDHLHYGEDVTAKDIKKASNAIYKICGKRPTAFRSTGGHTTKTIKKECKEEKMPIFYWSIDTEDWRTRNAKKIYKAVMNNVSDGDIILMHEIYTTTADAVAKIVPALIKKGYQIVTCTQLITYKTGKSPNAGEVYISA